MATIPKDRIAQARADENFPVASRLVSVPLRRAVLAFYRVARGADDIADSPDLAPEAKTARLRAVDAILAGVPPGPSVDALPESDLADAARKLRYIALRHAVDPSHARHLLQAFLADAAHRPCRDWGDLLAYCRYSAAPVGRFLLDLHGEAHASRRASDALCIALQILNHLQDCGTDWRLLRRCYLPTTWLDAQSLSADILSGNRSPPGLRRVFDRMLDEVDQLLAQAAPLPGLLAAPGLAREAAGIHALAVALAGMLRHRDPLAGRVALPGWRKLQVFALAAARARGRRTRSSFALALRLFPAQARPAIAAIYALARRLDDIVDGSAPRAAKAAALQSWRAAIDALYAGDSDDEPLLEALAPFVDRLPRAEFHALIDGLEMDATADLCAPPRVDFMRYCRGVAGAVGVLVLAACGHRSAADMDYAIALGGALQMVNVLRDLDEDAARGRLYLPAECLMKAGLEMGAPIADLRRDPRFVAARAVFRADIAAAFVETDAIAGTAPGAAVFAVRLMRATYRRILARLDVDPETRPRLQWHDHALSLAAAIGRGAP